MIWFVKLATDPFTDIVAYLQSLAPISYCCRRRLEKAKPHESLGLSSLPPSC